LQRGKANCTSCSAGEGSKGAVVVALVKKWAWPGRPMYVWAKTQARLSQAEPGRLIDGLERNEIEWNGTQGNYPDVETKYGGGVQSIAIPKSNDLM